MEKQKKKIAFKHIFVLVCIFLLISTSCIADKKNEPSSVNPLSQEQMQCKTTSSSNMGQYVNQYKEQIDKFDKYYSQFVQHLKKVKKELEKQVEKCKTMKDIIKKADYTKCDGDLQKLAKLANDEKVEGSNDKPKEPPKPKQPEKKPPKKKIMIDPGHGGRRQDAVQGEGDPFGAAKGSLLEKNIVLDTASKAVNILRSKGYDVVMTRTSDIYITLAKRAQMAASQRPDIFISVHYNGGGGAQGVVGIYCPQSGSSRLSNAIQSAVSSSTGLAGRSRADVRDLRFCRKNSMPSVYIEVAHIQKDYSKITAPGFIDKAAQGIANGIIAHIGGLPQNSDTTNIEPPEAKADDLEEFLAKGEFKPDMCDKAAEKACINEDTACKEGTEEKADVCSLCTSASCNFGKACEFVDWKRSDYTTDEKATRETSGDGAATFDLNNYRERACSQESVLLSSPKNNGKDIGYFNCHDGVNEEKPLDIHSVKGTFLQANPSFIKECQQNVADLLDVCVLTSGADGKHGPTYYLSRVDFIIENYESTIGPKIKEAKDTLSSLSGSLSSSAGQGSASSALSGQVSKMQEIGNSFSQKAVGQFQIVAEELVKLFKDSTFQQDIEKDGKGFEHDVKEFTVTVSENTQKEAGLKHTWEQICKLFNGPDAVKEFNSDKATDEEAKDAEQLRLALDQKPEEFAKFMEAEHKRIVESTTYAQETIKAQFSGCSYNAGKCALEGHKFEDSSVEDVGKKIKLKDRNFDQWSDEAVQAVKDLGKQNPEKLFVKQCQMPYSTTPSGPTSSSPTQSQPQPQQQQPPPEQQPSPSTGAESSSGTDSSSPDAGSSSSPGNEDDDSKSSPTPTYDSEYTPTPDPSTSPSPDPSATPTPTPSPTISVTPKPSKDCEEGCQECVGTRESHCHAHKGVCVCEESADRWSSINKECSETESFDEEAVLKCCLLLFDLDSLPENIAPPDEDLYMCKYEPVKSFALSIDYCQIKRSDTGLCCSYAFDEMPISNGCLKDHKTGVDDDGDGKIDEDPVDGIDNDGDGKIDEDGKGKDFNLNTSRDIDKISVSFLVLRNDFPASVFYAGDTNLKITVTVKNNNDKGFSGSIELFLDVFKDCNCSKCPEDVTCACDCKADPEAITSTTIPYILPGKSKKIDTGPVSIASDYINSSIQVRAEITDSKGNKAEWKGELLYIIPKGVIAITDAYFINDIDEKITIAYPLQEVRGLVKGSIQFFPATIEMYLIEDENVLTETKSVYTVEQPVGEKIFKTNSLKTSSINVNDVLKIGIEIINDKHEIVLKEILSEQPLPKESCSGTILTSWCEKEKASFKMSYPAAFLSVRNPLLTIEDVSFTDTVGTFIPLKDISSNNAVSANVHLRNDETIGFEGKIHLMVHYDEAGNLDFKETIHDVSLEISESTSVMTNPILFSKEKKTKIQMSAYDKNDITWFDDYIDSFFMPRITSYKVDETEQIEITDRTNINTQIEFGVCSMNINCEQCLPSCELNINEISCQVKPNNCDCHCETSEADPIALLTMPDIEH